MPRIQHTKEWWRQYRKDHAEHLREYKRSYDNERYRTNHDQEIARRKKWAARNPEKIKAQKLLCEAVRQGKLKRKPCAICGDERSHGHHEDYSKPLDVKWLCALHHSVETKKRSTRTTVKAA